MFTADELFIGLNPKLLKRAVRKSYYSTSKYLAGRLFRDCFYEILLDIIENNVTFVLPLKFGDYGELSIEHVSDGEFIQAYKKGAFRGVDFIKSQFTGNTIMYRYSTKRMKNRRKPVYVGGELGEKLLKYTNEGRQYY